MSKFRYLVPLVLGLASAITYGFVYEAKILKSRTKDQQFLGFSDFHDKIHPITGSQAQKIKQWLQFCDKKDTKVLLEDLSSKGSGGRQACGRFKVNSRGGILGGLTEYCQGLNLSVENVEYRYCRVSSLGPVLNDQDQHISQIASVNNISVAAIVKEIQEIIAEIRSYNDGNLLTSYYEMTIKEVERDLKKLSLDANNSMSIGHYLTLFSHQKNRLDVLKRLLTFDSNLLDLKLIHSIVNASHKKIIGIAGGSHIGRVVDALVKYADYEIAYATPVNFAREHDVKKCLGSAIIDDNFCMRPQPIDLTALDKYMHE